MTQPSPAAAAESLQLHPLHDGPAVDAALLLESGDGVWLTASDGRRYLDGLSGLWNVLIGHGNGELAAAAAEQLGQLAFFSNYAGYATGPTRALAAKLAGYAYPSLKATFFTSGGAEATESAFKTARYYWKRRGRPSKVNFIARQDAYHGATLAAMSATGLSPYWPMFEPRVPGFSHIPAPNTFRYEAERRPGESIGQAAARALEETILREGPENVAGFIAEPVQGAGGVIVPPDDYFPLVREICDRLDVLLIADEVITGFGRTGKWFGLQHWGIEPDIMTFAKGVTSGYLPLGGIQVSEAIYEAINRASPAERWMHAFTYSGHAACCAVGLKNLEILEREDAAGRALQLGQRLLAGLEELYAFPCVGDVRGLGLMAAVELVADRVSMAPAGLGAQLQRACQARGLITRAKGDSLCLAPPLIISPAEVDQLVGVVADAIGSLGQAKNG
ncbi:MAG: aspartate aminotransferase family protein [Candidatus Promineifilaceae bacterium]